MNTKDEVELKGILQDLINKFLAILNIRVTETTVSQVLGDQYRKGMEDLEVDFDMNFFEDRERFDFLKKYTFDNIKELNEETANKLRQSLSQGLMNLESIDKLKERVIKVMDTTAARATMIARTESNRAENMGRLDAANQSTLKVKKYVDATLDSRTSDICRHMQAAYGKPGQSMSLDGKFKYKDKEWTQPPFHPNCRTVLMFQQEGLDKEDIE